MPPIRLAVIASPALRELWPQATVHPDLLEVTAWTPLQDAKRYHQLLPQEPMLLQGGNLLGAPLIPAQEEELRVLAQETASAWISAHISLWPWKALQNARQRGHQPTALDLGDHLEQFFIRVRSLRERLGIPLLLENAPGLPGMTNDPESDPVTIAAVLEATGCAFLLDLSSTQTAANNWGCSPEEYMERLPLSRIVQIHVSAPGRLGDGRLVDAHEALREEDYYLLGWLLKRATPQVVTLEYWKEPQALHEQIVRLKHELGSTN